MHCCLFFYGENDDGAIKVLCYNMAERQGEQSKAPLALFAASAHNKHLGMRNERLDQAAAVVLSFLASPRLKNMAVPLSMHQT